MDHPNLRITRKQYARIVADPEATSDAMGEAFVAMQLHDRVWTLLRAGLLRDALYELGSLSLAWPDRWTDDTTPTGWVGNRVPAWWSARGLFLRIGQHRTYLIGGGR